MNKRSAKPWVPAYAWPSSIVRVLAGFSAYCIALNGCVLIEAEQDTDRVCVMPQWQYYCGTDYTSHENICRYVCKLSAHECAQIRRLRWDRRYSDTP